MGYAICFIAIVVFGIGYLVWNRKKKNKCKCGGNCACDSTPVIEETPHESVEFQDEVQLFPDEPAVDAVEEVASEPEPLPEVPTAPEPKQEEIKSTPKPKNVPAKKGGKKGKNKKRK